MFHLFAEAICKLNSRPVFGLAVSVSSGSKQKNSVDRSIVSVNAYTVSVKQETGFGSHEIDLEIRNVFALRKIVQVKQESCFSSRRIVSVERKRVSDGNS